MHLKHIIKYPKYFVLICIAVLFIDLVSTKIIIILASERYLEASILVFPVCMAFAIKSLGGITNIGISLSKKLNFT